jgi:peptidoglycan hydrolase-like protein with peptidoglycan-binding domain
VRATRVAADVRAAVIARRTTVSTTVVDSIATPARRRSCGRRPALRLAALAVGAGAALSVVTALGPVAAAAHAAAVTAQDTVPATPANLPAGIEPLAEYVGQVSCDPVAKPGTLKLARLLTATYSGTGYLIGHPCGTDPVASEHADGRALDWLVSARIPVQKAQADALLAWLLDSDDKDRPFAMARRMGVMYVIWDDQIWGAYDSLSGWRPYSTCASHPEAAADKVCRRDRMMISLSWSGAMAANSFWSKAVAGPDYGPCRERDLAVAPRYGQRNPTPCPSYPEVTVPAGASSTRAELIRASGSEIGPGDSGPVVSTLQTALGVTADGDYGPYTADAMVAFQKLHGLAPSGAVDEDTWRTLLAVFAVQSPTQPSQPTLPTKPVSPTSNPLTKYLNTVLQYDSRGPAVSALQRRLGVPVTAWFGPKTRVAVVAFQVAKKLKANGIVDRPVWKALGA